MVAVLCDKVIKWGLYLFVFLLPLFFLPFSYDTLDMNKQLLLVVFALILLIAWLGKMIAQGKVELKKSLLNLGVALFLIFSLASAVLAKNLYQGLVGLEGTVAESFFTLLGFAVIFIIVVNNFKDLKEISRLVFSLIISGLIVGLFGLIQLSGRFLLPWDFTKLAFFNSIGSANSLEMFLAALLVLSAVFFIRNDSDKRQQIFYGVTAAFFLFGVLSVNFPNVWWALAIVSIILVGLGFINRERVNQYRLILPMVVLAFSVLMLLTHLTIFSSWLKSPSEVSPSMSATVSIDKQILKSNFFFGTGPGSFAYDYGLNRSPSLNQTNFWNVRFNQGYSKVATLPSTLGFFGSLTWLLILALFTIYGLVVIIRRRGSNWTAALGFFSAWFLLAFLQFFYVANFTLDFLFWLMLALAFITLRSLAPRGQEEISPVTGVMLVEFDRNSPMASILSFVFVIVLVLTISTLYLGGTYYYAGVLFKQGSDDISLKNNLDSGSAKISQAVLLNPYNDLYLRSLVQASISRINNEFSQPQSAARDARIQNYSAVAINIAKRSTDLAPLNVDNWVQRAAIYKLVMPYTSGADQWAIDSYNSAIKLEPSNPSYYLELGRTYTLAVDVLTYSAGQDQAKQAQVTDYLAKAEEALGKAVALKGDYAPAIFQLALVLDREGKTDDAIVRMKQTQSLYPQDIGIAFQLGLLYYKKSSWDLAQAQFERAVILDQNYSNARYFLGLIYDKNGQKDKAIVQFQKIVELNPGNQDVKNILANLQAGKPAITQIPQQPSQLPIQDNQPPVQNQR